MSGICRNGSHVRSKRWQVAAFTLIELLVVIAIISLLVSILVPSLKSAQELAQSTICLSNLRVTAMAARYYYEDNDGLLFSTYWWRDEDYHYNKDAHTPGIAAYLGFDYKVGFTALRSSNTMLTCPSSWANWETYELLQRTFGMNEHANFNSSYGKRLNGRITNVFRPAEMSLFFDSGTSSLSPASTGSALFPDDYYYWGASDAHRLRNNWMNRAPHVGENDTNVIYVDGHAAGTSYEDISLYDNLSPFFNGQ